MRRSSAVALVLGIVLVSLACQRQEGPPRPAEVLLGEETCERCKMIISEPRFSAQMVMVDGSVRKFDDTGCMLHYIVENSVPDAQIAAVFVKSFDTNEWIHSANAFFVGSGEIMTPMSHGLVAMQGEEAARKLAAERKGTLIKDFAGASAWVMRPDH